MVAAEFLHRADANCKSFPAAQRQRNSGAQILRMIHHSQHAPQACAQILTEMDPALPTIVIRIQVDCVAGRRRAEPAQFSAAQNRASTAFQCHPQTKLLPQAIQIGAIVALRGPQDVVTHNETEYRLRRDALVEGLGKPGEGCWKIEKPLGTMFVWARIPEALESMGSLEFSKREIREAKVAVSPGIGFGANGEGDVRFALIENRHRIRQAVRGIRRFLRDAGVGA